MLKLTGFAATAMASALRLQPQVLRGVQMRMVTAHGLFPKQTSAGRGSGLDATARNIAKLLTGWVAIGASADPNLRDCFLDLDRAASPWATFGQRLENAIAYPELARTVECVTILPGISTATIESKDGHREQFGQPWTQHDGPQRAMLLPGRVLVEIAEALAAEQPAKGPAKC